MTAVEPAVCFRDGDQVRVITTGTWHDSIHPDGEPFITFTDTEGREHRVEVRDLTDLNGAEIRHMPKPPPQRMSPSGFATATKEFQ